MPAWVSADESLRHLTFSSWAPGMGQEVFNATVMFVAVVMLAWHTVWMGKQSRQMAQQITAVGKAVASGSRPLTGRWGLSLPVREVVGASTCVLRGRMRMCFTQI